MKSLKQKLATLGTIGLMGITTGCGLKQEDVYTIEQRGVSPSRPTELIKRTYILTDKKGEENDVLTISGRNIDYAESITRGGKFEISDPFAFDYLGFEMIKGKDAKRIYEFAKLDSEDNNDILDYWDENYRFPRNKRLKGRQTQ